MSINNETNDYKVIIILIATFLLLNTVSFFISSPQEVDSGADYVIQLDADTIKVIDPENGNIVYKTYYNDGSKFTEAIINDNE